MKGGSTRLLVILIVHLCLFAVGQCQKEVCNEYCSSAYSPNFACTQEGVCASSCRTGAYLADNNTKCLFCVANCGRCNANQQECDPGWCEAGFYRTNSGQCNALPRNCGAADGGGTCTACSDGYGLNSNNQCEECADNCMRCEIKGAGKCDTCLDGYTRKDDYTMCQACADNCIACHIAGPDKCDKCKRGYKIEDDKCTKRECRHGCLCDADDSDRCDTNDIGFTLIQSPYTGRFVVFRCGENCDRCNIPGSCISSGCKMGYTFHEQKDSCVFSAAATVHLGLVAFLLAGAFHALL